MAGVSLALGIVALIGSFIPFISFIAIIFAIVSIVLYCIVTKKNPSNNGLATAGLILSIIALCIGIVVSGCVFSVIYLLNSDGELLTIIEQELVKL